MRTRTRRLRGVRRRFPCAGPVRTTFGWVKVECLTYQGTMIPPSRMPTPTDLHLLGSISGTPAYETKTKPVPRPITVSAAIRLATLCAVPPTMQPTRTTAWPPRIRFLRPNTSLRGPASEKEHAVARDHAPTTQAKSASSPRSRETWTTIEAMQVNPRATAGPKDAERHCVHPIMSDHHIS
jgi:hypothetical protein